MKTLNSSLFQRSYHTLDEPTEVTANGRPLGTWYPATNTSYPIETSVTSAPPRVAAGENDPPFIRPGTPPTAPQGVGYSKARQAGRKP